MGVIPPRLVRIPGPSFVFVSLLVVVLFGECWGQVDDIDWDNATVIATSPATCDSLHMIAETLIRNVSGSSCEMDSDNNICNDCLSVNCTVQVGSTVGIGLPVELAAVIHPCFNGSNIHALSLIIPGTTEDFILDLFTTESVNPMVEVALGGFVAEYITSVTWKQRGNGVIFGVHIQNTAQSSSFPIFDEVFIPIECREIPVSSCIVPGSGVSQGLTQGEIIAVAVCGGLPLVALALTAVLIVLTVVCKRRLRDRKAIADPSIANDYYNLAGIPDNSRIFQKDLLCTKNSMFEQDNDSASEYTEISPYFNFNPKYGVTVPDIDFHHFNIGRKKAGVDKWDYPREKLIYMRELGEGEFGKVLLMKAQGIAGYSDSVPVAVKTLSSTKKEDRMKFIEETELMKIFSHPNIVSLLGTCGEVEDGAPMMILELMPYGDLRNFLIKQRENQSLMASVCDFEVYHIAADIASALVFLAENKYVHRDIAARNCLVGANFRVKLADFGLARPVHEDEFYTLHGPAQLPLRWMSPEAILYGKFSSKSDVWSFGVLLYEVMTFGGSPYEGSDVNSILESAKDGQLKLPRPSACPDLLYAVMLQCQEHDPDMRPAFPTIVKMLSRERAKTRSNRSDNASNLRKT